VVNPVVPGGAVGEEREMFRRLRLDFQSLEALQREYKAYMEHGELFVPTPQTLGLREVVDLELTLSFCGRVVVMQADVHGYRDWSGERQGKKGVSVKLLEPLENLRLAVADSTGILLEAAELAPAMHEAVPAHAPPGAALVPGAVPTVPGRTRRSERSLARVTVSAAAGTICCEGSTEDLSSSGALLCLEDHLPGVGEPLELTIFHPTTDSTQLVNAKVVRHATLPSGETAIGVEFDFSTGNEEQARRFLDEVRAIEVDPRRRTETITGSIDVLGLPTLVQMFSASVGEGTITLVRGQDRGRIVFSGGLLRYARTGDVTGVKALCRLLGWQSGVFHFAPVADAEESDADAPVMHKALFECIQKLDELARQDTSGFPPGQRVVRTEVPAQGVNKDDLDVLAFIKEGATVGDVIDGLPGFDVDIYLTLEHLLELNLIDLDIEL